MVVIYILARYHLPSAKVPLPSVADATLINGKGRYLGGPPSPLTVIKVRHGKRYRFRLLAISCDPFYTFSIDGHEMTIIETDGVNVEPLKVNNITLIAGQRYSFVLHANQKVDNYWVRAEPRAGLDGGIPGYEGGINSAILRYAGAKSVDPTTSIITNVKPLAEADLHPRENPAAPGKPWVGGADVSINLDMDFNATSGLFSINNSTWSPPAIPVLLQILSGNTAPLDLLPQGNVIPLPRNKVIELSMPPGGAVGNPVCLHFIFIACFVSSDWL